VTSRQQIHEIKTLKKKEKSKNFSKIVNNCKLLASFGCPDPF